MTVSASNDSAELVIGLVNIMPPAAMRTIENLFRMLLNACASPGKIQLRLFSLSNGAAAESRGVPQDYETLNDLWESPDSEHPLDALIVTGTESRARAMQDEACWPDLQILCDWAGENTLSTIWSCFSAHAAVLHLDNIQRRPYPEKLSGIFECEKTSNHAIFRNMPAHFPAPHSRYSWRPPVMRFSQPHRSPVRTASSSRIKTASFYFCRVISNTVRRCCVPSIAGI
jgi:homoserine O-succinyltransferase